MKEKKHFMKIQKNLNFKKILKILKKCKFIKIKWKIKGQLGSKHNKMKN